MRVFSFVLAVSTAVAVASADAQGRCRSVNAAKLVDLQIRRLDPAVIGVPLAGGGPPPGSLRDDLVNRCWAHALETFFGAYEPDLFDWVIYIDRDGRVYQALLDGGDVNHRPHGKQNVWAIVFSDRAMEQVVSGAQDTADFRFARRVQMRRRDPLIPTLAAVFGKVVGVSVPEDPVLGDSLRTLKLHDASSNMAATSLYVGYARFGLMDNVQMELSLSPADGKGFLPGQQGSNEIISLYTNFAQARQSPLELGMLPAASYGRRIVTYDDNLRAKSSSSHAGVNAYLIGVLNVPPWFDLHRAPLRRSALGLFLGTNVAKGGIFDEIVTGVSLSRIIGDAGISVGTAWLQESVISGHALQTIRKPRPLVGIDLRF